IPAGPAGPALAFGTPLTTGRVGPFLTALAPPPPPGFVGNPAAPQTVTGSPCGQNIFSIQGPGLPGGGLQTDQFTVLIGKIAHVCGNGIVDLGEQCDDGNLVAGDCCSPTCQFEPAGQACANNPCISGSTCDGAAACVGGTPNTLPCNDGSACTTADTCAGGVCVGGPPPNCVDGNVCTTDTCDPVTGCVNTPNTLPCDDLNPCTSGDTCAAGACVGTPNTHGRDDGHACTTADRCAGGAGRDRHRRCPGERRQSHDELRREQGADGGCKSRQAHLPAHQRDRRRSTSGPLGQAASAGGVGDRLQQQLRRADARRQRLLVG